jgi:Transposase IS66 family
MGGSALESDGTGQRVGKRNRWLWVFHHKDNAVFVADPSRGKCVPQAFLGEWRPNYWISDRYGGQMGWAAKDNQVCLVHLIRDVQYAIEAGDRLFAPGLRHLLGRACRIGQRRAKLADATLKTYAAPAHAAGVKLQRVIKKIRRHMFVFVTNRDIAPTNNGSERALRPCVTFRKITNGFRTEWGAALRRHKIRHRNNTPKNHQPSRRHQNDPQRTENNSHPVIGVAITTTGRELLKGLGWPSALVTGSKSESAFDQSRCHVNYERKAEDFDS